jgi:hypothetical protein
MFLAPATLAGEDNTRIWVPGMRRVVMPSNPRDFPEFSGFSTDRGALGYDGAE